jgi:hypothetical protein
MEHLPAIIALAALIFSILQLIAILLIRATVAETRTELARETATVRKDIEDRLERFDRQIGETFLALRQKLTDVEIWSRDNFARRDSYQTLRNELSDQIRTATKQLTDRLERMEGKLDKIDDTHREHVAVVARVADGD